jgi:quinolinate synthase
MSLRGSRREEPLLMDTRELQNSIRHLLKEKNAVLLAHYYQNGEIQDIADFLGDSLGLSIEASKTDADIIVFAGVRFMAESAAILSPDKTVLLPVPDAGCPLADTITAEQLEQAKQRHPRASVVTYVNSSAETKALSDICCTSSNAVKVVRSVKAPEIVMVPDGNLARYTARFTDTPVIPWDGNCYVHNHLTVEDVERTRRENPEAALAVHPECTLAVIDRADYAGSTSGIIEFCGRTDAPTVIIGTEQGIMHQLRKQYPGKTFVSASPTLICRDMKKITLIDILAALREMKYVVTVPERIRVPARNALQRMLEVS